MTTILNRPRPHATELVAPAALLNERSIADAELAFERRFSELAAELDLAVPPGGDDGETAEFRAGLEMARRYARRSLAPTTLAAYRSGWRLFDAWCQDTRREPLPAAAESVAAYLAALADGGYAAATIALRLQAINKAHHLAGFVPPGKDPFVAEVLRGIRRTIGVRPTHARDALDTPRIRRVIAASYEPTPVAARDVLLVTLAHGPCRLGASALARLDWEHVEVAGDGAATLGVHDGTRGGRLLRLQVAATGRASCPVRALTRLRALFLSDEAPSGPLFIGNAARRMSPSGITKAVLRILRAGGVDPKAPVDAAALDALATQLSVDALRPIDLRDRALLLIGFASAMRRANLADLWWADFTEVASGLEILLRRSKTDQEGRGHTAVVPRGGDPRTCPVAALAAWRDEVARQLGDPRAGDGRVPVFAPVDRHGHVAVTATGRPKRLDGEHINRIVAERASAAGLRGNFGAHSLRVGFITSAAAGGAELHEIADQTGHKSLDMVRRYLRTHEKWTSRVGERLGL